MPISSALCLTLPHYSEQDQNPRVRSDRVSHHLMGHIDVKGLKRATTGLPIDAVEVKNCRVCALTNIKRLKFPSLSHTHADCPLFLFRVHADICGPLPPGFGSFHYFIPFIDNYSHYIWIFFLKISLGCHQSF